jgi:putative acetyltransferase
VTVAAFKTLDISKHTEQFIITTLRAAKALSISLIVAMDGHVVGPVPQGTVTFHEGFKAVGKT